MNEFKKNVIDIVANNGWLLDNFSEFWDDEDIVNTAVQNEGLVLQYASDRLKNNKSIVLNAVRKTGIALQFASANLKADKEVVLVAVKNDPYALSEASEDLKYDDDILDACELKEE